MWLCTPYKSIRSQHLCGPTHEVSHKIWIHKLNCIPHHNKLLIEMMTHEVSHTLFNQKLKHASSWSCWQPWLSHDRVMLNNMVLHSVVQCLQSHVVNHHGHMIWVRGTPLLLLDLPCNMHQNVDSSQLLIEMIWQNKHVKQVEHVPMLPSRNKDKTKFFDKVSLLKLNNS